MSLGRSGPGTRGGRNAVPVHHPSFEPSGPGYPRGRRDPCQAALLGLAATVASWLVVHGIITTALGVALCVAAYMGHKRAQAAPEVPILGA